MAHSSCCSARSASDEADDGGAGGEDPDDVGATSGFFVRSFLGVVGQDLMAPVGFGEPGERQDLSCGLVEMIRSLDGFVRLPSCRGLFVRVVIDGPGLVGLGLASVPPADTRLWTGSQGVRGSNPLSSTDETPV